MEQFEIIKGIVGWVAVVLGSTQFLFQVAKVLKTKSTGDLSWWTFFQTVVLNTLWIFYGVWRSAPEIIAANVVGNAFCLIILGRKYLSERPQVDIRLTVSSLKAKIITGIFCAIVFLAVLAIANPLGFWRGALSGVMVVLNATQFMPQVLKAFKTKGTRDLSWLSFIQIAVVSMLWVLYGFWNSALEVVVANLFVHVSCDAILVRKYLSEKK